MSTPGPARGGYAAWVAWIEAFRRGEDPPTDGLDAIGAGLGSYVEARLLDRMSTAFTERVRQWQKAVGDAIVASPPDSPAVAAAMLRDAVVQLGPLATLAASPLLPPSLGTSMQAMLDQVRDGARTALEDVWHRRTEEGAGEVPA